MEDAFQVLELQFQQAEQELQLVSRHLEQEFLQRQQLQPQIVNPAQLLARLQKLRDEMPVMRSNLDAVTTAKKRLIETCARSLVPCHGMVAELAQRAGFNGDMEDGPLHHFTETASEFEKQLARI